MPKLVVKDALGHTLNVGDKIAYAVGAGRAQVLNFYEIHEFIEKADYGKPYVEIKARYLGGHAWRFGKPREFSRLSFPEERCLLLPKDATVPSSLRRGGL